MCAKTVRVARVSDDGTSAATLKKESVLTCYYCEGNIRCEVAIPTDTGESSCQDVLIYLEKVDNFQRPNVLIRESGRPILTAAVATPILKLCPLNRESSTPAAPWAWHNAWTNLDRDRTKPSLNKESGPGDNGRIA